MVSSLNVPDSGLHLTQRNVQLFEESNFIDAGTLYISEESLFWKGDTRTLAINYRQISVHAVSKDRSTFPHEHLLVMLDGFTLTNNNTEEDEDEEDDDDDPETKSCILRFVPDNPEDLSGMYTAMSDCQALNPDEQQVDSDFEGDDDDQEEDDGTNDSTNGHVGPGGDAPPFNNDEPMEDDQFNDP